MATFSKEFYHTWTEVKLTKHIKRTDVTKLLKEKREELEKNESAGGSK